MYNITFQQIETFLTVAQYLNLSRAAENMFVSQPTLSKTLQRFENGIGFEVFSRSNQGVALTKKGEYLYQNIAELYSKMESAINQANNLDNDSEKLINVVVPSSYDYVGSFDFVKNTIKKFKSEHPDVIIEERLYDFGELRRKLEYGMAEIAIAHEFALQGISNVECKRIGSMQMYLAISEKHPLASYDVLPGEKLNGETVFVVEGNKYSETLDSLIENCTRFGFSPKKIVFLDNIQTLLHVLEQGEGVSFCAKFDQRKGDHIRYYPFEGEPKNMNYCIAWKKNKLSQSAKSFLNFIEKEAKNNSV